METQNLTEETNTDAQRRVEQIVSCQNDYRKKYLCVCRMLAEEQKHSQQLEKIIGNQRKELRRLNGN